MAAKKRRWADIKRAHRNSRHEVTLVMDTASVVEAQRLAAQLEQAPEGEQPTLARRVRALEDTAADSAVTFVFEGLGRSRYDLLVAEHPATDEQAAAVPEGQTLRWNPETFPPALLAASCVEPADIAGDVEEWAEIHRDWSAGQNARLWGACLAANAGVNEAPKSQAASDVLGRFATS